MKYKPLLWSIPLMILGGVAFHNLNPPTPSTYQQSVWSSNYESRVYDTGYKAASLMIETEPQRIQFATCITQKLKAMLPNGIESIPKDSLDKLYGKFGEDCAAELKTVQLNAWSNETKKTTISLLMTNDAVKELNASNRLAFCTCYVDELVLKYPEGVKGQVPQNVQDSIGTKCAKHLHH